LALLANENTAITARH